MKSYEKPTSSQVDKAIPAFSSPQHEAYFFAHLENPFWIGPLAKRNVFAHPPKAEHVKGGGTRFPRWPPGSYLARMAPIAPEQVATILAKVQTDNSFIIGDIVDAALAMPANVATVLVPSICRAAREGTLWIHFKDASDLCVRLAQGGEPVAAMKLADALFMPRFEDGKEKPARQDAYWYKDSLRKVVPVLAQAAARKLLPRLCGWLKAAVEAKGRVDTCSGRDYSDIWRPAIEEHEQNRDYDFAGTIVGCVRDGFERAIASKSLSLDETLQIIEHYPYLVFRRIRLHLIAQFAEQNSELARATMLDRELFEEYGCKHEHARLLRKRFAMLDSAEQAEWLKWVQEIPSERIAEALTELNDPDTSQRRRDYWRFQRLHWVRDYLVGEHKEFYKRMLAECGEPDMADLNFRSGPVHWGSESPMTVEELGQMSFEQAVDVVSSWKPKKSGIMGPDIEGLASAFGQYVGTDPEQFSRKAQVLIGRRALFVRKFVGQMREAVNAGRDIDLSAVFQLCSWVLSQPVEEQTTLDHERGLLVDKDWQWTRDEICNLLRTICTATGDGLPKYPLGTLRRDIWDLLASLCRDRPAAPHEEGGMQNDPRVRDYLNFAINTPRGRAVETALEYGRWVANHIKKVDGKNEVVPGGFDAMPEVRKMLDWQIAKENRTVEAMAVLGSDLGLLYWIDKQWLIDNVRYLLPLDEMKETPPLPEAWAGWNAFLVWAGTHIEFYRMLKPQFSYAVERVSAIEPKGGHREEPMQRLGEHLMLLYGRGQLSLDNDGAIIRRFIESATSDLRRETIRFVGQTLDGDEEIPSDVIERFMTLWEEYWAGPGKKDAEERPDAWLFGWWFSCGKFPEQWALEQLEKFVEVAPTPEPSDAITKKLAEIAHIDVAKSVHILDRMIRGDQEGWSIHSCLDEARCILAQAMKEMGQVKDTAVALINYLGRRGFTDIGQLLKN